MQHSFISSNLAAPTIRINKMLEESGWTFEDTETTRANIKVETGTKFEGRRGFIDYLLMDSKGYPLAVVEAKNVDKDPLVGKEQARTYAKSQHARFIILTNSNTHYLWDIEVGNPTIINKFPEQITLEGYTNYKPKKNIIIKEEVRKDYLVLTQLPTYAQDPEYLKEESRKEFIEKNGLVFLRDYQLKALQSIQESIHNGNDGFLFEMATGTGKTSVSAAVIKLFLRTENAKRVLFLVDRIELEEQAWKTFSRVLKNDYACVIWKLRINRWIDTVWS